MDCKLRKVLRRFVEQRLILSRCSTDRLTTDQIIQSFHKWYGTDELDCRKFTYFNFHSIRPRS